MSEKEIVLQMKDLYVGYYSDLNILQNLNIDLQKG